MVTEMSDVAILLPAQDGSKLYVISLSNFRMILQRSLNTHGDIPTEVLTLSDAVYNITTL